jgi:hypothetical protein
VSLPIPDNVVEAHARTRWDREAQGIGNGGLWDDAPFEAKESALVESEQDLQAALAEFGTTVEHKGSFFPAKRAGIREYRDTHRRLVTAWTPVDGDS